MQNGSTEGMGRLTLSLSTRTLRKLYPNHSVVPFMEGSVNLMGYPGALVQPVQPSELVTSTFFAPVARRAGKGGGVLLDSLYFGAFSVAYDVSLTSGASPKYTSHWRLRNTTSFCIRCGYAERRFRPAFFLP